MDRRRFIEACVAAGGVSIAFGQATASAPPRFYRRTLLLAPDGRPLRSAQIATGTNYLFHYPYAATPCFLLDLGRAIAPPPGARPDGWPGGVGRNRSIVSFSAICAHRLAYPTREISFIRYQRAPSATSGGDVIHCCADHSIYDPSSGAKVVKGPAEQPLAAILLEYDPGRDELHAVGTQGPEQFEAFFRKYEFRLAMEYGAAARARAFAEPQAVVEEMRRYCRQTVEC